MLINLNTHILVKLTPYGDAIIYNHYNELGDMIGQDLTSLIPKKDESGYSQIQLWVFMSIFGEHIHHFSPSIVEDNIIEI